MANRGSSHPPSRGVPGRSRALAADLEAATVELAGLKAFGLLAAILAVGEVGRAFLLDDAATALPAAAVGFGAVGAAQELWRRRLRTPVAQGESANAAAATISERLAQRPDWLARFARHWGPQRDCDGSKASPSRGHSRMSSSRTRARSEQASDVARGPSWKAQPVKDAGLVGSSGDRMRNGHDGRIEPVSRRSGAPEGLAVADPAASERERQAARSVAATPPVPAPSGPQAPTHLLTEAEVRAHLRVSRSTFYRMRRKGAFPRPILLSEGIQRWRRSDVMAYLASPEAPPPSGTGHRARRPRSPR